MGDKISSILTKWELQDCEIKQIYDTAWQVGEDYVLKVYENLEMLQRNLRILNVLDEMNIPVGKPVFTCDSASYVSDGGEYYFLSEKLAGNNITKADDARKLALSMGEIIARLHVAFKKCEEMDSFWDNSILNEMNGWVKKNFESNGWKRMPWDEYEETVSRLAEVYDDLPVQLIHRDVHFGNFLFSNGVFSGYIDFDLTQRNIRIFDLCYFLLGLLSEEEKYNITEDMWFEFLENTFTGYEKVLNLSESEKKAVPYVMECIELLFAAWFEEIHDSRCAEDACEIFEFVRKREDRIWRSIL